MGKTHLLVSLRKRYAGHVPIVFSAAVADESVPLDTWFFIVRSLLSLELQMPLAQLKFSHVEDYLPSALLSQSAKAKSRLKDMIEGQLSGVCYAYCAYDPRLRSLQPLQS